MSGQPIRFKNKEVNSPTDYTSQLIRFQRDYQINDEDILENLDALLQEEADEWFHVAKNNWLYLNEFERDFVKIYLDEKFRDKIFNKIKFCNQEIDQNIHSFQKEIRKLFTRLYPRKDFEWELRRTYENLKLDYKILGCSKSFESGNENTFFFGEITFIAQYNLP